jgi:uncharacterized membrane protein YphA (DoxX/SURF4 family)
MVKLNQYKSYAPLLLRIALSLVFLWFGLNQIINQDMFLGYLPEWAMGHPRESPHHHIMMFMHYIPNRASYLLVLNGIFEIIFGTLLLLGLFTRISALFLGIKLFFIMITLGYNDVAVRDLGLSLATFSIFLNGPDKFSLDKKVKNKFKKNPFLRILYIFDKD